MSYVRCICGAVYNTVGTTTGMSGCCPKCGLHHSGQYRVVKPILKPSPLAAQPVDATESMRMGREDERMSEYIVEVRGQMPDAVYESQREPIVRCKDCKHLDIPDWDNNLAACYGEPPLSCMRPDGNGDYMRFEVEPDGFCKWGERK